MAQEPDQLRREIEDTRVSLSRDVDMLAEKTSPRRVARRRWDAVRNRVMGSTEQARDSAGGAVGTIKDTAARAGDAAGETAHEAADAVRRAPGLMTEQTQGNPVAAGIIAFGVGLLAATLMPVTDAERRVGRQVRENADQVTDRLKDVAQEMKDDVSGSVRDAVAEVKDTTRDAARTTTEQARSSARDATQQTKEAAQDMS